MNRICLNWAEAGVLGSDMRILIVEDDELLCDGLKVGLTLGGFSTEAVTCLADARHALHAGHFEAVVLDLMLPDGSGLDLLRDLRAQGDSLPVLILTARDQTPDKIHGLDSGADDYLGKPFALEELAARLRALVRRAQGRTAARMVWNGLDLDPARMQGRLHGQDLRFGQKEFTILLSLMERPGAIVSKALLEERLYGWQEDIESNTVEVHIHKLRAKLGSGFITTIRGAGYKLSAPQ